MPEGVGRPRVGLALGGGVWRGWAHVGVLSVLEREDIPIDYIAGTSAGALTGALYCAGVSIQQITDLALRVRWRDFARPVWPTKGFVSFAGLERWLSATVGDVCFAELRRPFAAVATDLETGESVVLREGRLARAVRASCSVPGFVTPVEMDGRLLGDGGVSNNVPAAVVRAMGADYVIGVDLFEPTLRRRWGPFGFGFAAIETLIRQAGGGIKETDCLITPRLAGASYLRFTKDKDLIVLGAAAAEERLACIRAALARDCWSVR